jgi:uncharacterized Zn finger protein (UPF0148 family)
MSTTRPRLKLDEQSFQGLLAAAFTIQEHNDKKKRVSAAASEPVPAVTKILESLCSHCAAPLPEGQTRCPQCGSDQFRPGERMQRKYASLWEMTQEQPVRQADGADTALELTTPTPLDPVAVSKEEIRILDVQEESPHERTDWFSQFPELAYLQGAPATDSTAEEPAPETVPGNAFDRLRHRWLTVPKADLYLGIAILIAALAIIWPAPSLPQRPHLEPWQRILVKIGIAEAPPASVHYRGDPNVQVWVDPHTALYYCPGEERYGKSVDGRYAAQREAQLEQFEPAGRTVCQ